MVGILKIQLGRLRVFSSFLLFESFEVLFMWGLMCIKAEFKLYNFQCNWEFFFFAQKGLKMRGGLEKEKCNF
jgi:hypothetical protein